jgi:hypothetical protein
VLTFAFKNNQNISTSSRSTNRPHLPRTLSNNRRTLSPKQWEICLRKGFDPPFTLQNQNWFSPFSLPLFCNKMELSR